MADEENKVQTAKRRSGRSPSYPSFSVEKAITQARALMNQEGEYAAPLSSAFSAWGYGAKSSGGRQTLATLKYFGLIEISGEGGDRKIKVSDIARRIILDQREDATEKKQLIRRVALNPAAHKLLFDEYPNGLASDGSVNHFLVFGHGFQPDAASDLLAEYKETAQYAGIYKPQNEVDKKPGFGDNDGENSPIQVGDLVNWESGGQIQWKAPRPIIAIDEDEKGEKFLKVRGPADEIGWIPMSQAIPPESAAASTSSKVFIPPPLEEGGAFDDKVPSGFSKEVIDLDEGAGIFIWPKDISPESFTDLEHWVQGIMKKAKRRAGVKDNQDMPTE